MLHPLKSLYGKKLGAVDGEIGHVLDFYFDDKSWAVRYLVVNSGSWLSGRKVLLTPHAFGRNPFGITTSDSDSLRVNLTRKQIEDSPSIETHLPVSRQFEEEYYRYYGWPEYWMSTGMWSSAGMPQGPLPGPLTDKPHHGHQQREDLHLRSTKAVEGYGIIATDGPLGAVADFLVDGGSWLINEIVVEAGHWYSGKEIKFLPSQVERISYEESTLHVTLTKADLESTRKHGLAHAETSRGEENFYL